VIGIDDATVRDYGRLDTWDRSLYARALNTLDQAGVRAVALDILFQGRASGDDQLAPVLHRPNVVLATTPEDPQGTGFGPRTGTRAVYGLSALNIDPDGVVRNFQRNYLLQDGTSAPSLSEQLARAAGIPAQDSVRPMTLRYVQTDRSTLPVLSFRDVINGNIRYSQLQDKLVIIGLTATGSQGSSYLDVAHQPVPGVILERAPCRPCCPRPSGTCPRGRACCCACWPPWRPCCCAACGAS